MFRHKKKVRDFVAQQTAAAPVLVIGDVMLDRYYFGEVKRISPEAPVPVTRVTRKKETLGGAANVAHNLARLGCPTLLVGAVGDDENRRCLEKMLEELGVDCSGLFVTPGPTTAKLRIIGGHQQMLRLDFEETTPWPLATENRVLEYITAKVVQQQCKAIIVSDYAKGVCTPRLCQKLMELQEQHGVPVIVDPKGTDWERYQGAFAVTPNLKELGEALGADLKNEDEAVRQAAAKLRRRYRLQSLLATRSEKGLSFLASRKEVHIPTLAQEVFDVSGAGDTVIAVFAAGIAGGLEAPDAARLANVAAGFVVGKVGTYAISREELLATLDNKC